MRVALLLVILFPAVAAAQWTTGDKVLVAAGTVALVVDYSTTEWAVERHGWNETNPLLGQHPSQAFLTGYTVAHLAAFAIGAAKLSPTLRRVYAATFLAIEGYCATKNLILGSGFALP